MDGPSIPWAMIEPWERRALANHDQTLQRLAERGGLSCLEAMCVLEDRKLPRWVPELDAEANQKLTAALATYDADGLRARIATLEAALRPFAENARRFDCKPDDVIDCQPLDEQDLAEWKFDEYGVTVGDLRRARAALAQPVGAKL